MDLVMRHRLHRLVEELLASIMLLALIQLQTSKVARSYQQPPRMGETAVTRDIPSWKALEVAISQVGPLTLGGFIK